MQMNRVTQAKVVVLTACLTMFLAVAGCDPQTSTGKDPIATPKPSHVSTSRGADAVEPTQNDAASAQPVVSVPESPRNTPLAPYTGTDPSKPPTPQAINKPNSTVPAFQPLRDAVAGEWVTYATLDSGELRYAIRNAKAAIVQTEINTKNQGKPLGQPVIRDDQRDTDPLTLWTGCRKADRSMTQTTITAAGRTWEAMLYEDRWTDEDIAYTRRTWVSEQVPVFGIIRMELRGNTRLEARIDLTAFGK